MVRAILCSPRAAEGRRGPGLRVKIPDPKRTRSSTIAFLLVVRVKSDVYAGRVACCITSPAEARDLTGRTLRMVMSARPALGPSALLVHGRVRASCPAERARCGPAAPT
jgi:hypothetical protein